MDPLAIQVSVTTGVKPVLALSADLGAVLREGRVVAGEVMQTLDGRSLLIGIGSHRVPADSSVELQLGDRFLARVEKGEDGLAILKVLGKQAEGESTLAQALRAVVGEDRPVGRLLQGMAEKLRIAIDAGRDPRGQLQALFEKLGEHVFLPGASAAELRNLIARSGLDYEALLLAEAGGGKAALQLRAALGNLIKQVMAELSGLWSGAGLQINTAQLESLGGRLLLALAELSSAAEGTDEGTLLGRLAAEVRARLGSALASSTRGKQRDVAMAGLSEMLGKLLGAEGDGPLMKQLLAALQAHTEPNALAGNLKAELMMAIAELPADTLRESISKAVAGIESEQLLNLARREFQEGWHLSVPIPDSGQWATAHLFYADPDDGDGTQGEGKEEMQRITVAVDFTRIGPLRAEIGIRSDLVALRVSVTDPEVARRLQAEAPALAERLSTGGRTARIAVVLAQPEEVAADALSSDIRWLREHHLMDLSG